MNIVSWCGLFVNKTTTTLYILYISYNLDSMGMRILSGIILFLSIFFMPFWFTFFLGIVLAFIFNSYFEIIPLFYIHDLVFSISNNYFLGITFVGLLVSICILFIVSLLKKKLYILNK